MADLVSPPTQHHGLPHRSAFHALHDNAELSIGTIVVLVMVLAVQLLVADHLIFHLNELYASWHVVLVEEPEALDEPKVSLAWSLELLEPLKPLEPL